MYYSFYAGEAEIEKKNILAAEHIFHWIATLLCIP